MKVSPTAVIAGLMLVAGAIFFVAPADSQATPPAANRVETSFWCAPPPPSSGLNMIYKGMAAAGFTVAMPPCFPRNRATNFNILNAASAAGLKVYVSDSRIPDCSELTTIKIPRHLTDNERQKLAAVVQDYKSHPALAGYFIGDEPTLGREVNFCAEIAAYLQSRDPNHPTYVNFYSTSDEFAEYWSAFVPSADPWFMSYDYYPFMTSGDKLWTYDFLTQAQTLSQQYQIPFRSVVQLVAVTAGDMVYRELTEAELRVQAMMGVAYGARAIHYFTYWTPSDDAQHTWQPAIVDRNYAKTRHYAEVRNVNGDLLRIGGVLAEAVDLYAYHIGPGPLPRGARPADASDPIQHLSGGDAVVGLFEDPDHAYALVVNRDYVNSTTVRLSKPATDVDVLLGTSWQDWSEAAYVQVDLLPGDATLLRWPRTI